MQAIKDVIHNYALTQPDWPAIVSINKAPLSYAQLQRQIEEIGVQLRRGGFASETRIGVALLDGPEAIVAILAVACHAAAVPINNSLSADELRKLFEQASLDAIVLTQATIPVIRKIAIDLEITIIEAFPGKGAEIACTLRMPARAAATATETGPASIALILPTSGTTGQPKLVPITHSNLISEAAKIRDWFKLTPDDRCLSALPLCYAHGLREILFPPILTGGSIARPANHTQLDIVEWLSKLKPTWYSTFPIFHRSIFELIGGTGCPRPVHNLRFILSAGTPLKPELQKGLESVLSVPVLEFYGIGEAGHMTANLALPGKRKNGTCGVPLSDEMMIARDGHAVPPGEVGEVLVRGPTVISGYLNNRQANAEAFVDGWFRTGDLGTLDADGFLSIVGRHKELINRGGEKLSPIEVEQALLRHPAVAEAAAFGLPHPRLGENVAAAVVLHASQTATPEELKIFVRGQLAPFKVPRLITLIRELPKDVTGKVQRRELAATLTRDLAAASAADLAKPRYALEADLMQLWRSILECDSIGLDDDFFIMGGDSLLAVQMRLEVEKMIGLVLPDSIPFEASTIRQFAQAVTECNGAPASPLTDWSEGGGRHIFFFFHGDIFSGGLYARRFAGLLESTTRLISIAPYGLGHEPIPPSIEQMARERLPLILAAQPRGPFRLGGYCNGGTVAFELVRLLQDAGHRVELLALIDTPMMNAGTAMRFLRRRLGGALRFAVRDDAKREGLMATSIVLIWQVYENYRKFRQLSMTKLRAKISNNFKSLRGLLRHWIVGHLPPFRYLRSGNSPGSTKPLLQPEPMERWRVYFRALALYFPQPLKIPIVFYSADHSGHCLKKICPQVEVVKVPSSHWDCVTTHMHVVADHLRKQLSSNLADPRLETANTPPVSIKIQMTSA